MNSNKGLKASNFKHGLARTRLDNIYCKMISRCYKPQDVGYQLYGGRGITVCDEWKNDKMSFFKWALNNGYTEELTLDRIDVNKGYSPDNCRWTNWIVQQNNRRTNHRVEINGETHTVAEWSRISGISVDTIYIRLKHRQDSKNAVFKPTQQMIKDNAKNELLNYLNENGQTRCGIARQYLIDKGYPKGTYCTSTKELIVEGKIERLVVHNGYHKGTTRYLKLIERS